MKQRGILGIYATLAILNIVASGVHSDLLDHVTKPFLMPLLALLVWLSDRRNPWIIAGLLFATAGDIALMGSGTPLFLAGMGLFLGCHICYITAFAKAGAFAKLRARPAAVIAYAIVLVVALALLWHPLGGLAAPIAVYAIALATMASAASTFGWWIGVGGALFLSSDMLIAIGIAAPHLFGQGVAVMITYTVGQALIATGWISTVTDGISVPRSRIGTSADSLSSRSTALR
jgi:uncharacterized membrane protein YhhN